MSKIECEHASSIEPRNDAYSVNSSLPEAAQAMSRSVVWGLAHPDAYKYYPKKTVETAQGLSQAAVLAQVELVA